MIEQEIRSILKDHPDLAADVLEAVRRYQYRNRTAVCSGCNGLFHTTQLCEECRLEK